MIGICKLCLEKKAIQNSHIIPNSYFKKLKRNGPAIQLEATENVPNIKSQDSWSEKLLCRKCEQHINKYEKYVIEFTNSSGFINAPKNNGKQVTFKYLNYNFFRLFQLSIIFRAAVATGREYYHIKLSEHAIDDIRKILINEEIPNEYIYGCQMKLIVDSRTNTPLNTMVGIPIKQRIKLREVFYFIFGGLAWEFYVPRFDRATAKSHYFIKRDGTMVMPIIDSFDYQKLMEVLPVFFLKEELGISKLKT